MRFYYLLILTMIVLLAKTNEPLFAQVDPSRLTNMATPPPEVKEEVKINMGANVNSGYSELFPVITPDETVLFFTRKGTPENTGAATNEQDEDIWYSVKEANGSWSVAKRLEGPLNTSTFDGVRAINVTATRLYLQNIYRTDGTRGKGFSVSKRAEDGSWMYPDPLLVEDYYNDTTIAMMAVSQSEDIIVFSLKRKDGVGKHDLYISKRQTGNKFSRPELIRSLSNDGDEISPFIAYDDRTIYFSTDSRGGEGLHDIFMSRRLDDTWMNWTEPVNLGGEINTPSFDAYLMVSASGDTAYFSSVHGSAARGFGKSDIWKIALPQHLRAGSPIAEKTTPIEKAEDYRGTLFRLDSVFFDVDKSTVRADSRAALDHLVGLLKRFQGMRIEVQGHTDSDASEEYNLQLSLSRAEEVRQYLIANGIDQSRVEAHGYGESQPIAPNTSLQGKQLNRRVMVLVKEVD